MTERERFKQYWRNKNIFGTEDMVRFCEEVAWEAWQAARRWIPVEERLPVIGVEVLCCNSHGDRFVGFMDISGGWHHAFGTSEDVVEWQPLPGSPEETNEPQQKDRNFHATERGSKERITAIRSFKRIRSYWRSRAFCSNTVRE